MKQVIKNITIFILLLTMLFSGQVFADSNSAGYVIESYNINLKVNPNNTFDITEQIDVNFTDSGKHGIYRKIPLRNKVQRLDGTNSTNRAKITNVIVSDEHKIYIDSGYSVIRIGSSNKTVSGKKSYVISYTYNIGKDPLKDADELYYNLIGTEWDTSINNVNFTITMPKNFDKKTLGFAIGKKYSADSSNVTYEVVENTIKGSVNTTLAPGSGLTVRLTLPEGYFVGASSSFSYEMLLRIVIAITCVIIAYFIWRKYGKDETVIDTVEFYPPDNLNSVELAYIYKGELRRTDIISLLLHLANKGYVRIEELKETSLNETKYGKFKIIKLKEYDGKNKFEEHFFKNLFESKNEVTGKDLYNSFYKVLDEIEHMVSESNREKIFGKKSDTKKAIIFFMLVIVFVLVSGTVNLFIQGNFQLIIPAFVLIVLLYFQTNIVTASYNAIFMIAVMFIYYTNMAGTFSMDVFIEFLIFSVCILLLIMFLVIIKKRTKYGSDMLGRIKGFKNFLEMVEKPKLEQLVLEDPQYFYNILPYTYVLGISNKWMKKFETIAVECPSWYVGNSNFSIYNFNNFIDSTYSSMSTISSSGTSRSGGGYSGGGYSGGGSGGGGGGSW